MSDKVFDILRLARRDYYNREKMQIENESCAINCCQFNKVVIALGLGYLLIN